MIGASARKPVNRRPPKAAELGLFAEFADAPPAHPSAIVQCRERRACNKPSFLLSSLVMTLDRVDGPSYTHRNTCTTKPTRSLAPVRSKIRLKYVRSVETRNFMAAAICLSCLPSSNRPTTLACCGDSPNSVTARCQSAALKRNGRRLVFGRFLTLTSIWIERTRCDRPDKNCGKNCGTAESLRFGVERSLDLFRLRVVANRPQRRDVTTNPLK